MENTGELYNFLMLIQHCTRYTGELYGKPEFGRKIKMSKGKNVEIK
jgi:hypothetical protein